MGPIMRPREFNFKVAKCGNSESGAGHIRISNKWIGKRVRVTIEEGGEPLTEREKEYIKSNQDEVCKGQEMIYRSDK